MDDLKFIRVEMCQKMLAALQVQGHDQWHNIVTGDESWFYFEYVRDRVWIFSFDNNTLDYPNRTIATQKHKLTVFWNPEGFQIVPTLPTGASFNAVWLIDGNFMPLRNHSFPGGRQSDQKKLMVHIDHANPHTVQVTRNFVTHNGLRELAHLPIRMI
jgi:hypothetical protein